MTKTTEILENAYIHYQASMRAFDDMTNCENEGDKEMAHIFCATCEEQSGYARGLLKAYEILTGKSLYEWEIKNELEQIADMECVA